MVNKVNGNDYYDYSKLKMPNAADKTANGEAFSLNYQRAQETAKEKEKKDGEQDSETIQPGAKSGGKRTVTQGGVRLELSNSGQASVHSKNREFGQAQTAVFAVLGNFRSWISKWIQSVKDFLYKVWNDEPRPDEAQMFDPVGEGEVREEEKLTEEYLAFNRLEQSQSLRDSREENSGGTVPRGVDREKEIQQYLRSGNLEQVLSLLTEDGKKTMAKNSGLLTYYDRTGRITQLNASDQERILHGDRNVRKL